MTDTVLTPTGVEILPLTGTIGAEIKGVDAACPLDDKVVAGIRSALLRYKVVFLRDQRLTYESQVALTRRFGDPTAGHPIFASPEREPLRREMDSHKGMRANYWHTDLTFVERPPAFALLYSLVIPPVGGDTLWANTAAAYTALPGELRELADRLRVVHSSDSDYTAIYEGEARTNAAVAAVHRGMLARVFEAEHPAVRVHPETAERSLLLGGFATRVVDYPRQASRDLLRILQEYVTRPEHTVRWKWRPGDLIIWDNQATQHYAVFDYGDAHRLCQRTTVAGPVSVGVDGRPGVALSGDPSAYYTGDAG